MEPIKINIAVGLTPATIDALMRIFGAQMPAAPETAKVESPKTETKPEKATEAPAPAPAEKPTIEDDDDLPPGNEPDTKPTPTEDDARQAVKAARSRGVPAKAIKDFMKESFNIASSVECPAERRQELIDGLNKLAA